MSVRRQRFGNFLRLAGIGVDLLPDDLQGHLMQIGLQIAVEIAEFRPQDLLDEAARRPDHDGRPPLPAIAIRLEPIAAAQRHE